MFEFLCLSVESIATAEGCTTASVYRCARRNAWRSFEYPEFRRCFDYWRSSGRGEFYRHAPQCRVRYGQSGFIQRRNLFARPNALRATDVNIAEPILAAYAEVNELIKQPVYSADWIGWIELATEPTNGVGTRIMAESAAAGSDETWVWRPQISW